MYYVTKGDAGNLLLRRAGLREAGAPPSTSADV